LLVDGAPLVLVVGLVDDGDVVVLELPPLPVPPTSAESSGSEKKAI
jgi:hypothetical protein